MTDDKEIVIFNWLGIHYVSGRAMETWTCLGANIIHPIRAGVYAGQVV